MSYPKTYRAIRRTAKPYPLSIQITEETLPSTIQPTELVLRIHAVALNYRDLAMLRENGFVHSTLIISPHRDSLYHHNTATPFPWKKKASKARAALPKLSR